MSGSSSLYKTSGWTNRIYRFILSEISSIGIGLRTFRLIKVCLCEHLNRIAPIY